MKTKIRRPQQENKSEAISLRLTKAEFDMLSDLRDSMHFKSTRDLFLFAMETLGNLYKWDTDGYRFFVHNPKEKKSYQIEFEFTPKP